jgi:hypothetical protein
MCNFSEMTGTAHPAVLRAHRAMEERGRSVPRPERIAGEETAEVPRTRVERNGPARPAGERVD